MWLTRRSTTQTFFKESLGACWGGCAPWGSAQLQSGLFGVIPFLGGLILVSKQGEWTKALLPQLLVITWPGYVCSRLSAVWLGLCQAFLTVQLLPAQVCLLSLPFTGVDSWETFCTSNSLWTSASGNPTCDHEMENMRDSDKGTVLWTVVHCVLIQMHIPHLPPPPHSRHTHRVLSQGWKNWLGN